MTSLSATLEKKPFKKSPMNSEFMVFREFTIPKLKKKKHFLKIGNNKVKNSDRIA